MGQMDDSVSMVPVPLYGTIAAAGSSITFPQLAMGTTNANRFDGRRIKIIEDATALAFTTAVTVTGVQSATTTTLTVNSTAEILAGDILEIGTTLEKVLVRAVASATTLTVTRGYQGTTATATTGAETVRLDPFGFVTAVADAGLASDGAVTVSPVLWTAARVAGEPYGAGSFLMYPKGLQPETLTGGINSVLRNTDAPHIWFPSLVTDSDFASNDVANWAEALATTTIAFATTAAEILFGERYLSIGTNATGEGVKSTAFKVTNNENLLVSTHVGFAGTTVGEGISVSLYNETTSAATKTAGTVNERTLTEVRFREAVPTTARSMSVRWTAAGATSIVFSVSPPVVVQSDRRRTYVTPSWFIRENQVRNVLAFQQGYASDVSDSYISLSEPARTVSDLNFYRSDRDANPLRVEFCNYGDDPIGFEVMRPFSELSYDTATTNADLTYVSVKTVANILKYRGDDRWRGFAVQAAKRAQALGYGNREVTIEDRRVAV